MKTIAEIEELTNMDAVYVCNHWSDLYEGREKLGVFISSQKDIDKLNGIISNFELMICRKRDGSEFYEPFNYNFYDFKDAQKRLRMHFTDNNDYFYKDDETEIPYLKECIKEIADADFDTIEEFKNEILKLFDEYKNFKAGYYDCNGDLVISEEDINAEDFSGYREDVWVYAIIAVINEEDYYYDDENQ
jgi:hypothetical protein